MGKLINIVQSNLFGRKKPVAGMEADNKERTAGSLSANPFLTVMNGTAHHRTLSGDQKKKLLAGEFFGTTDVLPPPAVFESTTPTTTTTKSEEKVDDKKKVENRNLRLCEKGDDETAAMMERRVYELERYYIFEENNTIDKYEKEKADMQVGNQSNFPFHFIYLYTVVLLHSDEWKALMQYFTRF